jgi:hypothetical protein
VVTEDDADMPKVVVVLENNTSAYSDMPKRTTPSQFGFMASINLPGVAPVD